MAEERNRLCVVVGAGISGLVQAAELLRKGILEPEELEILDRGNDYGGVWNAATYPGAGCDVQSLLYQVSWFRKPDWSCLYPSRVELMDYYRNFADKFQLRSRTCFNTNVLEAVWSDEKMTWTILAEDTLSRQRIAWTTKILIYAPGVYNRSFIPNISGISSFQGDMWHTYQWPAGIDLSGKVVAYIGSGPSAVQILQSIQPVVKSLKVYVRSMTYCLPISNTPTNPAILFIGKWIPSLLGVYATILATIYGLWAYYLLRPGSWAAQFAERHCIEFLEQEVGDPILREKLRPVGRLGTKRLLMSRNFYQVLQRPNVEVITDPVALINETGIISAPVEPPGEEASNGPGQGRTPSVKSPDGVAHKSLSPKSIHNGVDVIIWGTGYQMQGWGTAFKVVGQHNKTLDEHWGGAPRTLYGMATSGFPNLLFVGGPNTILPWSFFISGIENQAQYNSQIVREIKKRNMNGNSFAMMPSAVAETQYTEMLQPALEKLAPSLRFSKGSYYLNEEGRNTFFFPFTETYYQWLLRRIDWEKYVTIDRQS